MKNFEKNGKGKYIGGEKRTRSFEMDAKDYLKVYLVTDRGLSLGRPIEDVVEQAIRGGVGVVQLREKECPSLEFYEHALKLKKMLSGSGVPLIINDRLDIALAVDADGLHIGQSDLPYPVARRLFGKDKIIGLSTDNYEELVAANAYDVDYVAFQAFATTTKLDAAEGLGVEGLRKAASLTRHPLVAIGGIHLSNAESVAASGVDGIAVVSEIMSAENPKEAAENLRGAFEAGHARLA